jgi:hypothetical protein
MAFSGYIRLGRRAAAELCPSLRQNNRFSLQRSGPTGLRKVAARPQGGALMNDKTAVPPAIVLRQLAFVMRVSRALYAAAELKLADFLT